VTLNTIGSFTLTATDITDGAKSSDTTPAITVQDPTLVWKGGASNLWNPTALNWLNPLSTPVAFTPGAIALFNDTPAPLGVDIVGTVTPVSTSVDSTNNYTLGSTSGGLIGGTGGLTKAGTGTLTLTTANTYGGDTAINAGKLNAGNNSAFGSTGTVTLGNTGATLELANSIVIDRPLTLSNTGDKKTLSLVAGATTGAYSGAITNSETTAGNFELSVGTPGALTLSGAVAGNTLTKTGDGTLILSGAADNVGLILNATAGEVQLGKTSGSGVRAVSGISGISSGATVKLTGTGGDQILGGGTAGQGINGLAAGGTLNLNGNSESVSFLFGAGYSGGVVDGGSGTVTFTVGESNVASWFPGEIKNSSGTLSLVKVGTNTVTLIGANTYSGTTEIKNGALLLTYGDDRLPVTTAVILGSGPDSATLRLGSSNTVSDPKPGTACNQTITSLTTSGTGTANAVIGGKASVISTLTLNNSDAVVYGGRLGGAGTHDNELALTKSGAGTFTFSGTGTYKGNTTVSAGTLELAETGQLRFVLGASSGSNNRLTGTGTATINGDFVIDTTAAEALPSGTWTLEDVSTLTGGAYGSTFSVIGFTDAGGDKWTKANGAKTYIFDETTGILILVSDPFTAWAGAGVNFDDDANNDGVDNGLAWFLGATDEDASATGLLPKSTQNAGALVLEFYCLAGTARGTAVFEVQYSNDLGQSDVWAGTVVPATVGTFTDGIVDFEITDPEPAGGLLKVVATIPLTEAAAGKLFGRIVGVK
jgi:autotransporter-associated beta strand protein